MKKIIILLVGSVALLLLLIFLLRNNDVLAPTLTLKSSEKLPSQNTNSSEQTSIVAENLDTPWGLVFLPDNSILFTERSGLVKRVELDNPTSVSTIATLSSVREIGEGGLLGITLHPQFSSNHFVYLYYTYTSNGDNTMNRVVRMTYENNRLSNEKVLINNIPGASNHNGGRIKFGPDNFLYIGTGDAQEPSQAQNKNSLAGKILRVTDEGKAAPGNPFNNLVYSYGHRNVQGLAWDTAKQLWATEHGRSGVLSGLDEINRIHSGGNYGWPTIQGTETKADMLPPVQNSGNTTWAPSGMAFLNGSLFFAGLRGQALYEALLQDDSISQVKEHLKGQLGRIRDVVVGPDGMLYITTSNNDGRGIPQNNDDKIIRVNPQKL